ncbi:AAA family ATPase [Mycolicibacterium brisbanense]|nr:AAA family ATPase [Mycolicibacterium brisbanense]
MTVVTCRRCGRVARDGARFCDACGAPLAEAAGPAEYKQVTVLFADVVHSMDIAAAVGAERLREIMTELVQRCAEVVQRYGGTVDKFTGDGVMALFGAPIALEDHAFRACLTALEIQQEVQRLAVDVGRRDGLPLQLRIGLNSGEVIAGDIGSGPLGYTAVGAQVGLAQRMESVAPAGGVMLSESTARLVEHTVVLDAPQHVRIKGASEPVCARRLVGIAPHQQARIGRGGTRLVGRSWELAALVGMLDRTVGGAGCVAGVVGPPGIGKSRLIAETLAIAVGRGIQVFSAFCESHTADVPLSVVSELMRAMFGVDGVGDDATARKLLRARLPDIDEDDRVLLEDALSIGAPEVRLPDIGADARRRRVAALVDAVVTACPAPSVYVIEDAHWIDPVSEAVLVDLLATLTRARSLVLVTYRPEYDGVLGRYPGAQTIALSPLDDEQTAELVSGLLGRDASVGGLAGQIAQRAAGNPFFVQEIVRDLADRGVLAGGRGCYLCPAGADDVAVPATLQAAIAARVDRLDAAAKRTLSAAAVVGARFEETLLAQFADTTQLSRLVTAELIEQVASTPKVQYAFRHPMIWSVMYRAQLKSERAQLHRCVAAAIEPRDENAALIADHLEAGGELRQAYDWHMRAGDWSRFRDVRAARMSWERAGQVADRLPLDDPQRPALRIAPRALISGTSFRSGGAISDTGFDELRALAEEADDKRSLAIGMAGQVGALLGHAHFRAADELASELVGVLDAIADPDLIVGLMHTTLIAKFAMGAMGDLVRLAQRVIDLSGGDPRRGSIVTESPLLIATMLGAVARSSWGQPGWRDELDRGLALLRDINPAARGVLLVYSANVGWAYGTLRMDEEILQETAETLRFAEQLGEGYALDAARCARGLALVAADPESAEGFELLEQTREAVEQERFAMPVLAPIDVAFARRLVHQGDRDGAIAALRDIAARQIDAGEWLGRGVAVTALAEELIARGSVDDLSEVEAAIDHLDAEPVETGFVLFDIMALRLRTLLAGARGDAAYPELLEKYRDRAKSLGFEGHLAWAEEMSSAR